MDKKLAEELANLNRRVARLKKVFTKPTPNVHQFSEQWTTITTEEAIDIAEQLGGYVPDFIRIKCTESATLYYQTAGGQKTRYFEGLQADVPLKITNENWTKVWITPSASATITLYAGASEMYGTSEKTVPPEQTLFDVPGEDDDSGLVSLRDPFLR